MTKKFSLSLMSLVCLFTSASAQLVENNWQPTKLTIDGNQNDWAKNLRLYDSAAKIKYEFRNDDTNLYFVFKSNEKTLMQQIEQAGMTLKFSVKSKEKTMASIIFPKSDKSAMENMPRKRNPEDNDEQNLPEPNQSLDQLAHKEDGLNQHIDKALAKGFIFTNNEISSDNKQENSIRFAKSGFKAVEPCFEIAIPIRELFGDNYKLDALTKSSIKFTLTINQPTQSSSSMEMGSEPSMGGGPRGGGGMGGPDGGGGGDMSQRRQMNENSMTQQATMIKKRVKAEIYLTTNN